ncbi:MAG TPA: hypothetical protein VKY74_25690, partial [Chloroflexia bacterium]|nr:hypothetical protein [Chloroflexia bacterium]
MRRFWLLAIVGVVILSGLLVRGLPSGWSGPIPTPARPPAPAGPAGLLSGLPLAFVPGDGPGAPGYYTARTTGGSLAFTPAGVRLALAEPAAPGCGSQGRPLRRAGGRAAVPCAAPAGGGHQAALAPPPAIQLQWAGANPQPALQAGAALPGRVSSFRGADATHWRPGVATYGTLTYQGLYPGIDLTYTGTGRVLKGTYTVAPGAAPTAIRWRYAGAQQVTLDAAGNLQIQVGGRTLVEVAPVAWQELGGRRVPVSVRYQL